jgi:hypothetical protein
VLKYGLESFYLTRYSGLIYGVFRLKGGKMENTEGGKSHYFDKLWVYWSDKCSSGEITESQMENKIDRLENMSTESLYNKCKKLNLLL